MTLETGAPVSFFYVLEDPVRILVVDDDPIMREFAVVHLSTDKAEVAVAADGPAALEAARRSAFDIVLLDLEMPGMDGYAVLEQLRSDERSRRLPIIVMTDREDIAAIDRAFEAGATSFIAKPVHWRVLSYQLRYLHRTAENERSLVRQRTEARRLAHRAGEALRRVAVGGAPLIREAMRGAPELRRAAADYLAVLESAAGLGLAEDEAGARSSAA
jgi:CheY-like chemotaxis protein